MTDPVVNDAHIARGILTVRTSAYNLGREHGARGVSRPDFIPAHFRPDYLRGVEETWRPERTPRNHRDLR